MKVNLHVSCNSGFNSKLFDSYLKCYNSHLYRIVKAFFLWIKIYKFRILVKNYIFLWITLVGIDRICHLKVNMTYKNFSMLWNNTLKRWCVYHNFYYSNWIHYFNIIQYFLYISLNNIHVSVEWCMTMHFQVKVWPRISWIKVKLIVVNIRKFCLFTFSIYFGKRFNPKTMFRIISLQIF